jgi:2,3-bisphosphoglycerate-independent phosphoglycerate mutase
VSAPEVTDAAIEIVEAEDPDVLVLNYANPDMVGHTGDFEAAVAAVEAVDRELERLATAVADAGGHLLVTADHGNADDMGTPEDPHTAHTANPVPFVSVAPGDGTDRTGGHAVREGGSLCDVAPTLLALLGLDRPAMIGVSHGAGIILAAAGERPRRISSATRVVPAELSINSTMKN